MDYAVHGVTRGFIFSLTFTHCRRWISYLDKHSPALKVQTENLWHSFLVYWTPTFSTDPAWEMDVFSILQV